MRKLVAVEMVSLDGVMQAPGGKGEDPSGGFDLEGWTFPYVDESAGEVMDRQLGESFDLLLGKTTYEIFAGYWPKHTDDGFGAAFDKATKYVVSDEAIDTSWEKTVRIEGEVVEALKQLKAEDGPMLQVYGSGEMVQTLLEHDLVDELWLRIFPVTLGKGKRLFDKGTRAVAWKLTESVATPSGVIMASYVRDGEVKTGSFE